MDGIAEEIASKQRKISISEFFEENKQMLGFGSPSRALITAIKEAVDNALDVCEDMRELPEIKINVDKVGDYIKISVEDNGPGIPKENIGNVFGSILYGSRFGENVQSRGQQGIGISAAVLYSQISTNEKATVLTTTNSMSKANKLDVGIDIENNEPDVENEEKVDWDKDHGTKISMKIRADLRSRSKLIEYLEKTSIANPHSKIIYNGIEENNVYERATDDLPEKPQEIKPHPHGVDKGEIVELLESTDSYSMKAFLKNEFSKVGSKTASNIIKRFKNEVYGKSLPKSTSEIDFEQVTKNKISNKKTEDVELLTKKLKKYSGKCLSLEQVSRVVNKSADEVEEENDTRIGDTVRSNVIEGMKRNIIESDNYDYLKDNLKEVTSSRKSVELTNLVAEKLVERLEERDVTHRELNDIVSEVTSEASNQLDEGFGDTATKKVVDRVWETTSEKDKDLPNVNDIISGDNDLSMSFNTIVESLRFAMLNTKINRPSSKCLSPITPEKLKKGMENNYQGEFYSSKIRKTNSYSGHPFTIEAGITYDPEEYNSESKIKVHRYANRVPLIYQKGACLITKSIKNINWRNYSPSGDNSISQSGATGIPQAPFILVVHVASTNVPFTSESKDAIAAQEKMEKEIEQAVREAARELKSHLSKKQTKKEKRDKRKKVNRMMPDIAEKFAKISGEEVPDTGLVTSNITQSIVIRKRDKSIGVYNKIGNRRKLRIVLEGLDSLPNDSDFEEKDGKYIWEKTIYSSHEHPDINIGKEYEDIDVKNVEEDLILIEDKR